MTKEEKKIEKEELKKEIKLKKYGPASFAKNFIITQLVIIYFILSCTNIFVEFDIDPQIPRCICVFVFGFFTAFFVMKKCFELCTKEEYRKIKKLSHIYIGIIVIVVFLYGIYSVYSNVKEIEANLIIFYKNMQAELLAELQTETIKANIGFAIVAIVYLSAAELALFCASKKVSIDSLPDSREDDDLENANFDNSSMQNEFRQANDDNSFQEQVLPKENKQDIKFDL